MKTTTIIPILAALTLAAACTKTIEFSGKETASLPVLISQAEADSTLNVRLTYSRFFLDDSPFKIIDNASFHAELNGTSFSPNFTHVNQGLYNSDLTLHENDTLTLRVIVPDKGELTAGCRIPTRPQISDFTFTPEVTIETYPDYQHPEIIYTNIEGSVKFKFQLHDPAGQNNCYMIRAYLVDAKLKNKHFLHLQTILYSMQTPPTTISTSTSPQTTPVARKSSSPTSVSTATTTPSPVPSPTSATRPDTKPSSSRLPPSAATPTSTPSPKRTNGAAPAFWDSSPNPSVSTPTSRAA